MVTENDMTPEQWTAFVRLYNRQSREATTPRDFETFCKDAFYSHIMGCVMVPCFGMQIGIEKDGYTHT